MMIIGASDAIYFHTRANLAREEARLPRGAIARVLTMSGFIDPIVRTPVLTLDTGIVKSVLCELGAKAKKGEICATLDPHPFDETLTHEKTTLAAAEAALPLRVKARDRAQAVVAERKVRSRPCAHGRKTIAASRRALARAQTRLVRAEAVVAERATRSREPRRHAPASRLPRALTALSSSTQRRWVSASPPKRLSS